MITKEEKRLYNILEKLEIEYTKYEHKPVYTVEEANELDVCIPGQQCKNLFLRNKKGTVHYLVILEESKQLDLKFLCEQIGCTRLSFASKERLYKYLGLEPGSVSPFGLINDIDKNVEVLIDKDLVSDDMINFHPNVNTATLSISYTNFEKFIKWCGNKSTVIDIK